MNATRYFDEIVRRKRPYIESSWCVQVVASPVHGEEQEDGRIRFWGEARLPDETGPRYLHMVTLEDGETIHNAFFDRRFRKEERR